MAEKHVAVCDQCGREEPWPRSFPRSEPTRAERLPHGWIVLPGPVDLCSWRCVAAYAVEAQVDIDRGLGPDDVSQ